MIKKGIDIAIFETRRLMGKAAARAVAQALRILQQQKSEINMVFAAAPSQNEFLNNLTTENIDWKRINAFHMDEYIGLPGNSPASFAYYLQKNLFEKVAFKSLNYINGSAANPLHECKRYAALLKNNPVDIVCMGIGENNHIAFNDPPVANFNDPETVKVVELDNACRVQQVNDGCFPILEKVPTKAITLTIPALLDCKYIFCIVPGERKAQAVFNTFNREISEQFPSTALRTHGKVHLFLDRDSSSLLPV